MDLPCIGLSPPILGHAGCLRLRLGPPSLPLAPSAEAVAFHHHVHPAPGSRDDWTDIFPHMLTSSRGCLFHSTPHPSPPQPAHMVCFEAQQVKAGVTVRVEKCVRQPRLREFSASKLYTVIYEKNAGIVPVFDRILWFNNNDTTEVQGC